MTTAKMETVHEIGILIYPHAQLAAVHGLTDLFSIANSLSTELGGGSSRHIRVSHWATDTSTDRIRRTFTTGSSGPSSFSALILPPSLHDSARSYAPKHLCRWIRGKHAGGTILCSLCAGTFLLAETGLLAGHIATPHWRHAEEFHARFPAIQLSPDALITDDGDIVTASGGMAWIDLGLKLIGKMMSPTVMLATGRFFLVDPTGRKQSFYAGFSPKLHHGDPHILKLQHLVHRDYASDLTVTEMASFAGLGERTFLRRFHRATGWNPLEYLQHWRVCKARESLEFSLKSVEEIAVSSGYQDVGAFRSVFKTIVGLPPTEYRYRFGLL
jgi:transcriptional regulator GlxA family with amidase domain